MIHRGVFGYLPSPLYGLFMPEEAAKSMEYWPASLWPFTLGRLRFTERTSRPEGTEDAPFSDLPQV